MLDLLAGLFASLCVLIHVVITCATKISAPCIRGSFIFAVRGFSLQSDSIFFIVLGFRRLGSAFVDWILGVQPNCSIQLYCAILSTRI